MIRFEKITEDTENIENIRRLYTNAFPMDERIPFYILILIAKRDFVEFLSIYDDETWIGFIHTLVGEDLSYIFYFAIDDAVRQRGYGSKVLQEYKKMHPRLSLAIEPVKKGSDNLKERINRLEFYKKNGFETLGVKVIEMGVEFELMGVVGTEIKKTEYQRLVKEFFSSFHSDKVMSVEEMREADAYTIKNFVSSKELMKRAGEAVFYMGDWEKSDRVIAVCGTGNNAGDGYVTANFLKEEGIDVELLLLRDKFSDDGKYYFEICKNSKIKYRILDENINYNELVKEFDGFDYIIDCIYGTGFKNEVKEPVYSLIKAVNDSKTKVVSVDINSGMNCDTGESNICVESDLTVSIGFLKKGLVSEEGKKHIGKLINMDIGIVIE